VPYLTSVTLLALAVFVRERSDREACLWQESPPAGAAHRCAASRRASPSCSLLNQGMGCNGILIVLKGAVNLLSNFLLNSMLTRLSSLSLCIIISNFYLVAENNLNFQEVT
jgi:hypothetical protein